MTEEPEEIRLLLIEDSDDDAVLVVNRLRRSGLRVDYERVETADAMCAALARGSPDIVISDNGMPAFNAEAALQLLRDTGLDVPFIVVSGQIGEESATALMRAGAHDFVLKDKLARLGPAVQRELREARDRQERRRTEAALRTSEERFRLVAENLQDVLFRFRPGPAPVLEYISPAIAAMTGLSPEELYEQPELLFGTMDPDDREVMRRSWQSPPGSPLTVRWSRPDGTRACAEQRLVAVYDAGVPIAVEGLLRDITAQVDAAEQRRELERQLHQAERLDSLGQLAGGVAHDFNNLLGVISGYTAFVLDELGPAHPCRPDLENIDDAARRATALTRQLLIFSRLQPSQPEMVDLNAVVGQIERLLRRTIGEDIEFSIDIEPDLDFVTIDPSRLEQIIMNLVVNARAAMPEGGRLVIRTARVDDLPATAIGAVPRSARYVCLAVADTGCGMDEEVQRRAFEPFFTTRSTGQGSGLGLATVYGAVQEASGAITVDSAPGAGTRIAVYLPAADRPAPTTETDSGTGDTGRGHGERVLVVEDDDDIRTITRRVLTRGGYEVSDASTREEALRLIRDDALSFDLLLSDVIMPGMPVLEFIQTVLGARPSLHIVFMSGYTADSDRRLPDGVPIVNKPFSGATLLHQIHTTLHSGAC
ncbi:response regulator [Actinoplanes sp. NEAU-A12]|uniref:histidine kinase n=1 Tax=Actinoplanes sandaracinus TaxID=3045177 RepID=A0ABT6WWV7_9ACTN|nr:response regulator [Actinoplanes sandaracinus]MDI6104232.1 response regulator [Actinoplanes sandaracinus]